MSRGLLLVGFDFAKAHTDEFHDWYDLEHVPERRLSLDLDYANAGWTLRTRRSQSPLMT